MRKEQIACITALRHTLHENAELSLQETHTQEILKAFLRTHTSLEIIDRGAWFYARKTPGKNRGGSGGAGRAIAFRADMDALPIDEGTALPWHSRTRGVAHKCGHDGHCAALCGLALLLEEREITRPVCLIFQCAEEIGEGAKRCVPELRKLDVSLIYAFHNLSAWPEGALIYRRGLTQPASCGLRFCFAGRACHASEPEKGVSPALACAKLTERAAALSSAPGEALALCTVVGVKVGSGDFGVSPGDGTVSLTLRAASEAALANMDHALSNTAGELAAQYGLTVERSCHDRFPETRNETRALDAVLSAAEALGVPTREMPEMWRASEDFGCFTHEIPGAIFYLGSGENHPPLHSKDYDFNDALLPIAAELFFALAGSGTK